MDFKENPAIYIQKAKIISIRDLAVNIEVNLNAVQRSYDFCHRVKLLPIKEAWVISGLSNFWKMNCRWLICILAN
jgi:hypothetical protein